MDNLLGNMIEADHVENEIVEFWLDGKVSIIQNKDIEELIQIKDRLKRSKECIRLTLPC
jgi:hypothetical protein